MMRKTDPCAKCGSDTIFSAPLLGGSGEGVGEAYIQVHENPNAMLFKGSHKGAVRAWICGNCGYTELYTTSAHTLYKIYDKARTKIKREEAERMQHPSALLLRPASSGAEAEPKQLLRPSDKMPDTDEQIGE